MKWGRVLLRDVLAAADFREKEQRDFRRTLIVARASDGYVALFTWGELRNTKVSDSILVITSEDVPLRFKNAKTAVRLAWSNGFTK